MSEESKSDMAEEAEEFESEDHGSGTNISRWPDLEEEPEIDAEIDEEIDELVWNAVKDGDDD